MQSITLARPERRFYLHRVQTVNIYSKNFLRMQQAQPLKDPTIHLQFACKMSTVILPYSISTTSHVTNLCIQVLPSPLFSTRTITDTLVLAATATRLTATLEACYPQSASTTTNHENFFSKLERIGSSSRSGLAWRSAYA